MTILKKEDWQFLVSYLEPKRLSYDKAESDFKINSKRNTHFIDLVRTFSFLEPSINQDTYFIDFTEKRYFENLQPKFNKNKPFNSSEFFEKICDKLDGKVDLKKNIGDMFLLIANSDLTTVSQSNISLFLHKKDPQFIEYLGDLLPGHRNRTETHNWIGKIAMEENKKTKTPYELPEWFVQELKQNRSFYLQVKSEGINASKPFFDGLLSCSDENIKDFLDSHDENLSKVQGYLDWKQKLPARLQRNNIDFDQFTTKEAIKVQRTINFNVADLLQNHALFNTQKHTGNFYHAFFEYVQNQHKELVNYEKYDNIQELKTQKTYSFSVQLNLDKKSLNEYLDEIKIKEDKIKETIISLKQAIRLEPSLVNDLIGLTPKLNDLPMQERMDFITSKIQKINQKGQINKMLDNLSDTEHTEVEDKKEQPITFKM